MFCSVPLQMKQIRYMKHAFIILLLTPLFLVSCQAGSQRGRIDVSADSIPVEMTEGHDVMSDQEKEDSIKFASYLQLFKDTASVEASLGSKLFGFSLVSPDEFYQKMEQYRDLYPVSADSSCVYYPGVCVQEYPYAYVTLLRMGDSKEEYTDHYTEILLVTYSMPERRMIDSEILGRNEKENCTFYAVKSVLSPLYLVTRQFVFDVDSAFLNTLPHHGRCEVTETEYIIEKEGYLEVQQRQWRDEGDVSFSQDDIDYKVYLKSEKDN